MQHLHGGSMKKRIFSVLLTLCMVLCFVPANVLAQGEGSMENIDIIGVGTQENPYFISTAEDLKAFRDIVNGENGQIKNEAACAVLTADIVLNEGSFDVNGNYTAGLIGTEPEQWTPIGDYKGTFDGQGHTIKGLYIQGNGKYTGLFSSLIYATVQNLTVEGYISHKTDASQSYVGGIAADSNDLTLKNCRNLCNIQVKGADDYHYVYAGGVSGYLYKSSVINCRNDGNITAENLALYSYCWAGGVTARVTASSVTASLNTGEIKTSGSNDIDYIGGIAGQMGGGATVSDCFNTGNVSGMHIAGGIVGHIADNYTADILYCYTTGKVSGDQSGTVVEVVQASPKSGKVVGWYLKGSAAQGFFENRNSSVSIETTACSARELANGTVLAALIKQRADGEHPWDAQGCKPLSGDVNDITELPVFLWQKLAFRHHGGTAYCNSKKVCEGCGESYGDIDLANHALNGKLEWTQTAADHLRKWSCCGMVTVEREAHKFNQGECSKCGYACLHADSDNNHICDLCSKVISDHAGEKATCVKKAVCNICKSEYGETDEKNHTNLKHADAKAATEHAEGNIEYWYCDDCGKYYSDAEATKEISKAETVIKKLPKPSQTGDASKTILRLMFIGAAAVGITVVNKKKNLNKENN